MRVQCSECGKYHGEYTFVRIEGRDYALCPACWERIKQEFIQGLAAGKPEARQMFREMMAIAMRAEEVR